MTIARRIALSVFLLGYLVLLLKNTCYFAAGPDSSGYLNEARMLGRGRVAETVPLLAEARLDPSLTYLFTPYGFVRGVEAGTMVPTYPMGTSLHLLAGAWIGGWAVGPYLVVPIAAVFCLFLTALVARRLGISNGWSVVAAMLFAASPVLIAQAVQPVSDVLALLWTLIAIACALKAEQHWGWAAACGVAFAMGVAVRPTNILLIVPLMIALRKRTFTAVAAAAPFALALMWYANRLYGNPFATGYGDGVVSLSGVPACLATHAKWLAILATPLVFPGGLFVAFDRRVNRALLLSWFGVFFVFYAYYAFCPDHTAVRFLLPALPALIIGFVVLASRARIVGAILVIVVLALQITQIGRRHVLHLDEWDAIYPRTVQWVDRNVPQDAIVMSAVTSGAFYFHSKRPVVRWDQLSPETTATLRANARFARPWYAVVSDVEGGLPALRARVPGEWHAVGRIRDVTIYSNSNVTPDSQKSNFVGSDSSLSENTALKNCSHDSPFVDESQTSSMV
ncbi:MAG TPA: hypothetical protein VEK79_08360 [Thermoanaerobaculia bacterium]|nr:hypothetical protein [Thermoanaerobaculia bacterium]